MRVLTRLLLYPGITVIAITVSFFAMRWVNPTLTHRLLLEDHFVEWLQVALFAVAGLWCVGVFWRSPDRIVRLTFVLLAAASAFVILEELSWGQRLLNLDIPASVASWNRQGELNLHNHRLFEHLDWVPFVLFGLIGLTATFLGRYRTSGRLGLFAPPGAFGLAFLFVLLVEAFRNLGGGGIGVFEWALARGYDEVREIAVAFVVFAYAHHAKSPDRARVSAPFANRRRDAPQAEVAKVSPWIAVPGLVLSLGQASLAGLVALDGLALRGDAIHRSESYAVYYNGRGAITRHAAHFVNFSCDASDTAGRFYVHSFPVHSGDLEPAFSERGFHNMDLGFTDYGWRMFGVCWIRIGLPDYPINLLHFGQYIPEPSGRLRNLWRGEHTVLAEPDPNP